ncbi:hypothetical protein WDV06_37060, partial [Streptomyces racemochromogenes]
HPPPGSGGGAGARGPPPPPPPPAAPRGAGTAGEGPARPAEDRGKVTELLNSASDDELFQLLDSGFRSV